MLAEKIIEIGGTGFQALTQYIFEFDTGVPIWVLNIHSLDFIDPFCYKI